jgi:hypothetical protein
MRATVPVAPPIVVAQPCAQRSTHIPRGEAKGLDPVNGKRFTEMDCLA